MGLLISSSVNSLKALVIFGAIFLPILGQAETVINGLVTADYKNVVHLGDCTASYVGPGVLLTELHCVQSERFGAPIQRDGYWVRAANSIKVDGQALPVRLIYSRGKYTANSDMVKNEVYNVDLAVIELASVPNEEHLTISTDPIKVGSPISFVGFSPVLAMYKFSGEESAFYKSHFPIEFGAVEKKVGYNNIFKRDNEYLHILGKIKSETNDGSEASTGEGDSGGPMLFENKVVGVVSGGSYSPVAEKIGSKFVDLSYPECQELFKALQKVGVPISISGAGN